MAQDVKLEFSKLKTLLGYLTNGLPKVKVGIIGSKAAVKRKDELTNAQIGFIQEFGKMTGKPRIPARSFIDMPLKLHLKEYMEKSETFSKKAFEKAIKDGKAEEFAKKVGVQAEGVIQEAFETSGWGQWEQNRPSTIKRKGSDKPLIDTGELRRSISSEVIK